jgi:hypothetical protein
MRHVWSMRARRRELLAAGSAESHAALPLSV